MKIFLIAGARPNFMKIAPIYHEAAKHIDIDCKIVHTGQHYDYEMSNTFFDDLEIPEPDFFLNCGSGTHANQTAKIMIAFEELCQKELPNMIIVVGDVNSTLACSIVAKKLLIGVAHVEAGLRSYDLTMPEEINRIVTDSISDFFFVTEESGVNNLLREGKDKRHIHFVGNVMIDNLFYQLKKLKAKKHEKFSCYDLKKRLGRYSFLTLHRPSNVDSIEKLQTISDALAIIAKKIPIVFPVHPRTRKMIEKFKINLGDRIHPLPPLGFSEALFLWKDAALVLTDSGGLQEETTALNIPCITLRDNTERPITIQKGTNILAGSTKETILNAFETSIKAKIRGGRIPDKWDGKAAKRIWEIIRTI